MVRRTGNNNRNNSNYLLGSVIAGFLFGASAILLKIASSDFYISPYSLISGVMSLVGYLIMQKSLYSGRISIVISLITALSIVTTFVLSMFVFNESVTIVKWIGVGAVIFGTFRLVIK